MIGKYMQTSTVMLALEFKSMQVVILYNLLTNNY